MAVRLTNRYRGLAVLSRSYRLDVSRKTAASIEWLQAAALALSYGFRLELIRCLACKSSG